MNKERPILFSGPMVRAILEGRKTQTRRIIKGSTGSFWGHRAWKPQVVNGAITGWVSMNGMNDGHFFGAGSPMPKCPYGQPGDRLWVRETWTCVGYDETRDQILGATGPPDEPWWAERPHGKKSMFTDRWKPSIHMPRWASRITLEVVSVRVERLQDISEKDAKAEGVPAQCGNIAIDTYAALWDKINGPGSWDANPWVWAVEFKRIDCA